VCKDLFADAASRAETQQKRAGQRCRQCGGPIPLDAGNRAKACSVKCGNDWQNQHRQEEKRATTEPVCQRQQCGKPIPESRRRRSKYCSPECKKAEMGDRWRASMPDYNREYLYGITPEQWAEMLAAQNGVCAICQTTEWGGYHNRPHADHDHKTKRFRGILTQRCNLGLGNFDDDPLRLASAIVYLTRDNPDALRAAITHLQERLIPVPAAAVAVPHGTRAEPGSPVTQIPREVPWPAP
jgi:predicted nucleic acid-binding Zn ribbon protein